MNSITIVDRAGTEITIGSKVRVQRPVGRYARKVELIEGTIQRITSDRGAILRLAKGAEVQGMHDTTSFVPPGREIFVPLPGQFQDSRFVCERKVEDFDYGSYHAFVEVLH